MHFFFFWFSNVFIYLLIFGLLFVFVWSKFNGVWFHLEDEYVCHNIIQIKVFNPTFNEAVQGKLQAYYILSGSYWFWYFGVENFMKN